MVFCLTASRNLVLGQKVPNSVTSVLKIEAVCFSEVLVPTTHYVVIHETAM